MRSMFTFLLYTILAGNVSACLCEEYDGQKELVAATDKIVHGIVISQNTVSLVDTIYIDPNDSLAIQLNLEEGIIVNKFEVLEIRVAIEQRLKGNFEKDTISIYTELESVACGERRLIENKEYIIFGNNQTFLGSRRKVLYTSKCSGNRVYSEEHENEINKYLKG